MFMFILPGQWSRAGARASHDDPVRLYMVGPEVGIIKVCEDVGQ